MRESALGCRLPKNLDGMFQLVYRMILTQRISSYFMFACVVLQSGQCGKTAAYRCSSEEVPCTEGFWPREV